jgi:predicted DNA-binding transcriptional regulator AlpA
MSTPSAIDQSPIHFWRLSEVTARLGISKSEVHRRIHSVQSFPKPIRMGARCVVYSSVEVDAYMRECIAQRDAKAVAA